MKLYPMTCMECGNAIGFAYYKSQSIGMCVDCAKSFAKVAELCGLEINYSADQMTQLRWKNIDAANKWHYSVRMVCKDAAKLAGKTV